MRPIICTRCYGLVALDLSTSAVAAGYPPLTPDEETEIYGLISVEVSEGQWPDPVCDRCDPDGWTTTAPAQMLAYGRSLPDEGLIA